MAYGYDVAIKLYQHHVIERVPTPRDRKSNHAVDAIIVLMYFVVVTLLFLLLAKHSSAALPCKRFVLIIATPHHTQIVSFTIIDPFPCKKITERLLRHDRHFGRHFCIGAYGEMTVKSFNN